MSVEGGGLFRGEHVGEAVANACHVRRPGGLECGTARIGQRDIVAAGVALARRAHDRPASLHPRDLAGEAASVPLQGGGHVARTQPVLRAVGQSEQDHEIRLGQPDVAGQHTGEHNVDLDAHVLEPDPGAGLLLVQRLLIHDIEPTGGFRFC